MCSSGELANFAVPDNITASKHVFLPRCQVLSATSLHLPIKAGLLLAIQFYTISLTIKSKMPAIKPVEIQLLGGCNVQQAVGQ